MLDPTKYEPAKEGSGSVFSDNVLPFVIDCYRRGEKAALVTFVAREGAAPRPIGAQMAISESGQSIGYIASDCLGDAIKSEALSVLSEGTHSLIRFGKGSKYIDLQMPCGSGIDLYFDGRFAGDLLSRAEQEIAGRRPFALAFNIKSGETAFNTVESGVKSGFIDENETTFLRPYFPRPRIFLAGTGPNLHYLATLARMAKMDVRIVTSDEGTAGALARDGFETAPVEQAVTVIEEFVDRFTAAALMFHEHALEQDILAALLARDGFYIGAMGSKTVHAARVEALASSGITPEAIARVNGPIGSLGGSKNPVQIAVSAFAEILERAHELEYIC